MGKGRYFNKQRSDAHVKAIKINPMAAQNMTFKEGCDNGRSLDISHVFVVTQIKVENRPVIVWNRCRKRTGVETFRCRKLVPNWEKLRKTGDLLNER